MARIIVSAAWNKISLRNTHQHTGGCIGIFARVALHELHVGNFNRIAARGVEINGGGNEVLDLLHFLIAAGNVCRCLLFPSPSTL